MIIEIETIKFTKYLFLSLQCLDAKLNLDQNQIENLASDIENAINGVADVEQILTDTAEDITTAEDLKARAEAIQVEAKAELDRAESVVKNLSEADESQNAADIAVSQTRNDIDSARADLGQVRKCNCKLLNNDFNSDYNRHFLK